MPSVKKQKTHKQYIKEIVPWLQQATFHQATAYYGSLKGVDDEAIAYLGRNDRYFLLTVLLGRIDAVHPWLYERCREVELNPDNHLDLWARGHYKSTLITFVGSIQEILNDPEITIGIFSHTRPIAKAFLDQIRGEFERNEYLKQLYPEILWENTNDAPTWSLDGGIVVKRKSNPKEKTIEAWGLVDGQPTSKHFNLLIYDDTVTIESVTTADQIAKTTERWELSQNLRSIDCREWYVGTRYNYADTYKTLLDREKVTPRLYPATDDGTLTGKPVFLTQEAWDDIKKTQSLFTIACQQLQNPNEGGGREFEPEWIRTYEVRPLTLNVYIMVDYAGSRKSTGSSNTAFAVIGVDHALNKYLLDGAVHKMSLNERWILLKNLRAKWLRQKGVQLVKVGYERFGAQSDIEHFETMMKIEENAFPIEELNWPRDGDVAKDNRIRRLEPDIRNWRFFFPYDGPKTKRQYKAEQDNQAFLIAKPIKRKNHEGKLYDVTEWMIENEYMFFPNTTKKDMLDAMSRIYDMDPTAPQTIDDEDLLPELFEDM